MVLRYCAIFVKCACFLLSLYADSTALPIGNTACFAHCNIEYYRLVTRLQHRCYIARCRPRCRLATQCCRRIVTARSRYCCHSATINVRIVYRQSSNVADRQHFSFLITNNFFSKKKHIDELLILLCVHTLTVIFLEADK